MAILWVNLGWQVAPAALFLNLSVSEQHLDKVGRYFYRQNALLSHIHQRQSIEKSFFTELYAK